MVVLIGSEAARRDCCSLQWKRVVIRQMSMMSPQSLSKLFAGLVAGACGAAIIAGAAPVSGSSTNVMIRASAEWIPLKATLEVKPGSALDFSGMGFTDAPAGKHGWVIARPNGTFAFEDTPDVPRRFYGVNLCFGAQYLAKEESDRLAERLQRLGYNAVRIHHYERDLVEGQNPTTKLNERRLDQFDYLTAALIKRGMYLTTDLYVSRSVPWREVGIDRDGRIPMDTFKILVPVHEGSFENWKQFTRALLGHRNPYTGRRYAEEPALAWLSMINEGNFGNFYKDILTFPEWTRAWNQWLSKQYGARAQLAAAWGADLKGGEDPAQGTVALPQNLRGEGLRARDCIAFLSATERAMIERMRAFLREELKCRALISNANSWTYFVTDQWARQAYDYVDDHFYVDHPQFLEGAWRLPSKCANTSPLAEGATGGRSKSFTRLMDKPFTITEYNYSGPGRFRGVGGILTGAMGALQGWSGIWRFAYSHGREAMFSPSRMGYFDMASDPLSQAAERASLCLFLRGDMEAAPHSLAIAMSEEELAHPASRIPSLHPRWHWTAWITRVGTVVSAGDPARLPYDVLLPLGWKTPGSVFTGSKVAALQPYSVDDAQMVGLLRERGILTGTNPTDPGRKLLASETGQVTIDGPQDMLVLDTPRTAGGYAPAGRTIRARQGGVTVTTAEADATVWVSALDDQPISTSRRLLVTHLTDLQNTEITYREAARQVLLDWGRLPHLVRAGKAEVQIKLANAVKHRVFALATDGERVGEVAARVENGALCFTANVGADPASARMLYEVVVP